MGRLRRLFELFEQKTSLLHLLDLSQRAQGVQIYIGGESGLVPLDECSVVTAPYEQGGRVIGTLGVIGPTRMEDSREGAGRPPGSCAQSLRRAGTWRRRNPGARSGRRRS